MDYRRASRTTAIRIVSSMQTARRASASIRSGSAPCSRCSRSFRRVCDGKPKFCGPSSPGHDYRAARGQGRTRRLVAMTMTTQKLASWAVRLPRCRSGNVRYRTDGGATIIYCGSFMGATTMSLTAIPPTRWAVALECPQCKRIGTASAFEDGCDGRVFIDSPSYGFVVMTRRASGHDIRCATCNSSALK